MGVCTTETSAKAEQDVMFVGLDNSGKTTIIKQILGHESLAQTSPTMGFDSYSYYFPAEQKNCKQVLRKFKMIDLGGHERIRAIWNHYYDTSLGLVYVFDAADEQRFSKVADVLKEVLSTNSSKSILICGNKQDLNAKIKNEHDLQQQFQITLPPSVHFVATVGIVECSELAEGVRWLLSRLCSADTSGVDKSKYLLNNKRRFGELSREQKMEKLAQIKKENDEAEQKEADEKEEERLKELAEEHAQILDDAQVKTRDCATEEQEENEDNVEQNPTIFAPAVGQDKSIGEEIEVASNHGYDDQQALDAPEVIVNQQAAQPIDEPAEKQEEPNEVGLLKPIVKEEGQKKSKKRAKAPIMK